MPLKIKKGDGKVKVYKATDKDMKCRGFQYELGKQYAEERADLCNAGFHACEAPLDVLGYYPPGSGSRYFEAELEDVSPERSSEDSKVVGKKITLGAEIGIPGLVKAHVEYVKAHTTVEHTDPKQATAGFRGAATAGSDGAATAGESGAATAGDSGAATAGFRGAATAGSYGAATAGSYGAATAGYYGAATSRGSSASGKNGLSVARGNGVKVKGGIGAVLVIVIENDKNYDIKEWKATVVDGKTIKTDTWYTLKDGEFVEVTE